MKSKVPTGLRMSEQTRQDQHEETHTGRRIVTSRRPSSILAQEGNNQSGRATLQPNDGHVNHAGATSSNGYQHMSSLQLNGYIEPTNSTASNPHISASRSISSIHATSTTVAPASYTNSVRSEYSANNEGSTRARFGSNSSAAASRYRNMSPPGREYPASSYAGPVADDLVVSETHQFGANTSTHTSALVGIMAGQQHQRGRSLWRGNDLPDAISISPDEQTASNGCNSRNRHHPRRQFHSSRYRMYRSPGR